jgi:hypothetical protein
MMLVQLCQRSMTLIRFSDSFISDEGKWYEKPFRSCAGKDVWMTTSKNHAFGQE